MDNSDDIRRLLCFRSTLEGRLEDTMLSGIRVGTGVAHITPVTPPIHTFPVKKR